MERTVWDERKRCKGLRLFLSCDDGLPNLIDSKPFGPLLDVIAVETLALDTQYSSYVSQMLVAATLVVITSFLRTTSSGEANHAAPSGKTGKCRRRARRDWS